jgi:uncharacterized protein with FMN-binding domain
MKKFILSVFVLASFGLYVILQNNGNSVVLAPVVSTESTKKTSNPVAVVPTIPTSSLNTSSQNIQHSTPVITPKKKGIYNDGEYTGDVADAYYGSVQVKAIVSNGAIADVQFLDYPQDARNSARISARAMPILKQEAISAQSANVNAVSGASETSSAFVQSLTSALNKAKA